MMSFVATAGAAEELEDLNTFAVVLAERSDGSGSRLEIQRALTFDEADRQSGMDTYCLCTHTGATHYGGVKSWQKNGDKLELLLDAEAADELGIDVNVSIELRMAEDNVDIVLAGLRRVLATAQ